MHLTREVMLKKRVARVPQLFVRPTLISVPATHTMVMAQTGSFGLPEMGRTLSFWCREERRDHILIDDVAGIICRCVRHCATGIVNAVSGTVTSFKAIAEMAAETGQPPVKVLDSPRQGRCRTVATGHSTRRF